MKGQTHDLKEIRGAIKVVQTETTDRQPCDSLCRKAGLWREVVVRSVWCAVKLAGMLQGQAAQNQELVQKSAHMEDTTRQSKKAIKELSARANEYTSYPLPSPRGPGAGAGRPGSPQLRTKGRNT